MEQNRVGVADIVTAWTGSRETCSWETAGLSQKTYREKMSVGKFNPV